MTVDQARNDSARRGPHFAERIDYHRESALPGGNRYARRRCHFAVRGLADFLFSRLVRVLSPALSQPLPSPPD